MMSEGRRGDVVTGTRQGDVVTGTECLGIHSFENGKNMLKHKSIILMFFRIEKFKKNMHKRIYRSYTYISYRFFIKH